eukprot:5013639-Amphidinium_carterae.1
MSAAESDDVVIQVWDTSRAHQHCQLKRKSGKEFADFLVTALNGVRDAAQSFEHTINETLTQNGFKQCAFSPCVYHSKEHKI